MHLQTERMCGPFGGGVVVVGGGVVGGGCIVVAFWFVRLCTLHM